ncbi:hypothetical protein DYH11_04145 [Candidatus Microgenomates bacterium CPR3]|nr:hypothetical protein [Candidatus Microgenomates bacterium CPR3]
MKKIILLLFTFYFLLSPTQASASTGLSVSPPVTEVLISPNKSLRTTLQLTNSGSDTSLNLSLHAVIPTDALGHTTINPKPLDLTSIPLVIKLIGAELDTPIELKAGQTKAVTLELEAANLDEPTDVYLALLARPIALNASPTVSTVAPGIAALILSTITPSTSLPTNIELKEPDLPVIHDNVLPLKLDFLTENKTNIMLQAQVKVKLTSPTRNVLFESKLEPQLILGQAKRSFAIDPIKTKLTDLGPHTLNIEVLTIGGRAITQHSYIIWFLPIRYLLVATVVIILFTIPFLRKILLTKRVIKA